MKRIALLVPMALATAACEDPKSEPEAAAGSNVSVAAPAAPSLGPRPLPTASLPEVPFTPESAQGAATVVETYYALIEAGQYDEARALRWDHDTLNAADFRNTFERYAEYHATVGAPSPIQGAAGSLYVEVPVHLYGRLKSGKPFGSAGTITLRRVNDVPGSNTAERRWRIYTSD